MLAAVAAAPVVGADPVDGVTVDSWTGVVFGAVGAVVVFLVVVVLVEEEDEDLFEIDPPLLIVLRIALPAEPLNCTAILIISWNVSSRSQSAQLQPMSWWPGVFSPQYPEPYMYPR